ncbi:MAG: ZIP family metal transporter, partial [Acidobacteriota bacterium]
KGPDAFALSTVLLVGGHPLGRILKIQGIFSLTTPAAALAAMMLLRGLSPTVTGLALGAAAGTLLAVATEDLLPEVHRRGGRAVVFSTLALLAGILLVAGYQYFLNLS